MNADRQSRMWPYLGLLFCFFALSATAPRAWQEAAQRYRNHVQAQAGDSQPGDAWQEVASTTPTESVAALADDHRDTAPSQWNRPTDFAASVPATAPIATTTVPDDEATVIASPPGLHAVSMSRVESVEDRLAMLPPELSASTSHGDEATQVSDEPQSQPAAPRQGFASSEVEESALAFGDGLDNADLNIAEDATSGEELADADNLNPAGEDVAIAGEIQPEGGAEFSSAESLASEEEFGSPRSTIVVEDEASHTDDSQFVEVESPRTDTASDVLATTESIVASLPTWAVPQSLLDQMAALESLPKAAAVVASARALIERLTARPLPAIDEQAETLRGLGLALQEIERLAAEETEWENKARLLRVQYSLARRLEVWRALNDLVAPPASQAVAQDARSQRVASRRGGDALSPHDMVAEPDHEGRRRQFGFDALTHPLRREDEAAAQRRRLTAVTLARRGAVGGADPREVSPEGIEPYSAEQLAQLADFCRLLAQIERFETHRSPAVAQAISRRQQSLLASSNEAEQALGKQLEQHYRNANLRFAISEEFMNRFLPEPQVFDAPVSDTIMGASISGHSRTLNKLRLRVIPDNHKIRLGLEAHGVVHSNTGASSGPVTIFNRGETTYIGRKLVLVSPTGMHVWPAVADANAASDTQAINTQYDAIPVLRSIIRNAAQAQQDEAYGQAMAEVESRVEETVRRRLDREADPRIAKMRSDYEQQLQGPLDRLGLSATPISLSTTQDRAIARLRVAGETQLGAHTPRPCAPSDSLASAQVHESVLNNAAGQLGLNGQTFTLPELHRHVADSLGMNAAIPEDMPEDAQVTFAAEDAVVIRCDEGKIWITLSIAKLSQGRRKFENFRATAVYQLVSHGLHTELERDGVVQLAGKRLNLGEQIALRGVISKLFTQNNRPQVISQEQAADPRLAGLRVTQLVVADGWIGLAVASDRVVRGNAKTGTSANR